MKLKKLLFIPILVFSVVGPSYSLDKVSAPISAPKGMGLIIDSVASDFPDCSKSDAICASSNALTVLKQGGGESLKGQTLYIFPDFASITDINNLTVSAKNKVASRCLDDNAMDFVFNYQALPLMKPIIVSAPKVLGSCIPGQTVTKSYQTLAKSLGFKDVLVMPMFNGDADELNNASSDILEKLAQKIGEQINNDPNTQGVAFDLEGPSLSIQATKNFIGPLAKTLLANNKFVAVYDSKLQAMSELYQTYPNVMAMVALYDYGLHPGQPFQPLTIDEYGAQTLKATNAHFGGFGKNVPVLFVMPGAASTTIWQSYNVFNMQCDGSACKNAALFSNLTTGANLTLSKTCSQNASGLNQGISQVLSEFLTIPLGDFLNNCNAYTQKNVSMNDYMESGLQALSDANVSEYTSYKGVVLYNSKFNGFYALNCAKDAPSQYQSNYKKACQGFYPEDISSNIWTSLWHWSETNSAD